MIRTRGGVHLADDGAEGGRVTGVAQIVRTMYPARCFSSCQVYTHCGAMVTG